MKRRAAAKDWATILGVRVLARFKGRRFTRAQFHAELKKEFDLLDDNEQIAAHEQFENAAERAS